MPLLCAVFSVTGLAQDEKNYDAVYASVLKEYTLNGDGSMVYRYSKEQKLLTYRAINNMYGETFVVYNPDFQKLKIDECVTTMADGKRVKTPANAFNEVLPGFAANAPAFNMLREMVITHTALERNAVIRLDYSILSEKDFYPALAADEVLSETEPVRSLTIRVRIPAGKELAYKMFNLKSEPVRTTEGNFRVYTWRLENLPVISAEDNQPGGLVTYPRLVFTTATDAAQGWAAFSGRPAFTAPLPENMRSMIAGMVSATADKALLALNIQEKVASEVNLAGVPMRYTGFRLRTPAETWSGNYGTIAEKTLLLAALLREAGIPAHPAAVVRASLYDKKIANLYGIEDLVVKAEIPGGRTMWLSATSPNPKDLSLSLPDRVFLAFGDGGKISVTETGPGNGAATLDGNLYISPKNEMSGEVTLTMEGAAEPAYALIRDKGKARQWISGGLGAGNLKEVKRSQEGPEAASFTFDVQKDNALQKDTVLRIFPLPSLSGGFASWGIRLLPSYRNTPFELPWLLSESVKITLAIPDGMEVPGAETEVNLSNPAGTFRFEVRRESGKIVISRELKFSRRIIEPEHYTAFKTLVDNYNVSQAGEIILRVK